MIAGRYELEREIGRGGMGAVWLARDEVLGRPVAIKRTGMAPGSVTPDQERSEREARLAARLSHPHVVAVFDLVDEDEVQWLVMEYVAGVTLAKLIDRDGAVPPDRAARLMAQAADALTAAHAAGIVHRDVKPSNMLIAAPDGHVKLLDFGIARADSERTLTATGLVTGSPSYLAPEVASGEGATPASDVWSLGASMFHMLSGRPPYDVGDNLMGALYRIVHEDPPRLDNAGWLAPVLEGTMTKDAERRWSMRQVHEFLLTGPGAAPPVPPADEPASTTRLMTPVPDAAGAVSGPGALAGDEARRRWAPLPIALAAAALLVVALIAAALLGGGDEEAPPATGPTEGQSSSEPSEPQQSGPTRQGMETFIADYLATAPSSPETTYEMLTPGFQRASGGFEGYSGFWGGIESADLVDVTANPDALTVAYTVDYVSEGGESSSDEVVLRLAFRDGRYLIADES